MNPKNDKLRIVAIGASAGGLEALQTLFDNMPNNTDMAFLVVQHLSPDFKSLMDELLARHTQMSVELADHQQRLKPNHIYLIPPGTNMEIEAGKFKLTKQNRDGSLNLPIDICFVSVAKEAGENAVGIVLSGTGSDGARGVRAIKEAGGLIMAQEPKTARFDGMPRSAIASGCIDAVLPPEEIPKVLVGYSSNPIASQYSHAHNLLAATNRLDGALAVLARKTGVDFSDYKRPTASRRIARRMGLRGLQNVDEYLELLRADDEEAKALTNDLLIGVTRFFRDPESWDLLQKEVLTSIVRDEDINEIRVWIAGCATGEEAYTLAMLIEETLAQEKIDKPYKIFATDLNEKAIRTASIGEYPTTLGVDIGAERLATFFNTNNDSLTIRRKVREHIVFARHDVLRDAPFNRLHLVSCRNLLIYVEPSAQRDAISYFHNALLPGGALFLGSSETLGVLGDSNAFKVVSEAKRIWLKNDGERIPLPRDNANRDLANQLRRTIGPNTNPRNSIQDRAQTLLLERYCPPSLLLDSSNNIVHTFGNVEDYLAVSPGKFSTNISTMASPDIKVALLGAVNRRSRTGGATKLRGVDFGKEKTRRTVNLEVVPLDMESKDSGATIVTFKEERASSPPLPISSELGNHKDVRIQDLEIELQQLRENLQATVEELETSNEELQATNEELIASNEELQSTNEELQSVNEELHTLNSEYQEKIKQLIQATADNDHLLATTGIGVIFLSKGQEIRKFTLAATDAVNIRTSDIGRPMGELSHMLGNFDLTSAIDQVLESGKPFRGRVKNYQEKRLHLTIHPSLNDVSAIDGAVVSFTDVTQVEREQAKLDALLNAAPIGILIFNEDSHLALANEQANEILGQDIHIFDEKIDGRQLAAASPAGKELEGILANNSETPQDLAHDNGKIYEVRSAPVRTSNDQIIGKVLISQDVTTARSYAKRLEQSNSDLRDFAYVASHDMKAPLRAIIGLAELLSENIGANLDQENEKYLQTIVKRSRKLSEFLNGLLSYSVVGELNTERTAVDLDRLIADIFTDVSGEKKFKIKKDKLPTIYANPVLVEQVLRNLISNAVSFTPNSGLIQVRKIEGNPLIIDIIDSGPGIPKKLQSKVFDLFQSFSSGDSKGGTGLGLAIAKKAAFSLGGSLHLQSQPGNGAKFRFKLPHMKKGIH